MPTRAGAERIPENLRVHVCVPVDKAGRDDRALGVDDFPGGLAQLADGGNPAAVNPDVGAEAGRSRAVDNLRVTNDQI